MSSAGRDWTCLHYTPSLAPPAENLPRLLPWAERGAAGSALLVLPELCTTGFCLEPEQAAAWAEPLDGPTVTALAALARRASCVVVAGVALRDPDGVLRNAQVVLDADGRLVGHYAKHHLWGSDLAWARAGEPPGAALETAVGRVGLLVCHDVVYPGTVAAVAAQLPVALAFSTAWVGGEEAFPTSWVAAALALAPAPLLAANRGGREGETAFTDPSAVVRAREGRLELSRTAADPGPHLLRLEGGAG